MNTELVFQTVHSVNQLSVYGAVTNWCHQFGLTEEEKERVGFAHGRTRRSGNVGTSPDPGTWKQDARKRELQSIGTEETDDTIM